MERSCFGAQLVAVRENEDAAQALGINAFRIRMGAICRSAAIMALTGVFYLQKLLSIDPGIACGPAKSVAALLAPIIGGPGTVLGPLVGASFIRGLPPARPLACRIARSKGLSSIRAYVAHTESGEDAGVRETCPDPSVSLRNIEIGSRRAEIDDRLYIDTLIPTGGSTSGCVRATCVDSLARGYRTIVPEECVTDKLEILHSSNLCDMSLKDADVVPVAEIRDDLEN